MTVGQPVVALGAPLGLSGTVTSGIVSALDRNVHVPGDDGGTALLVSAIQTDAAINPGNSGGALVNCDGELVGVPTAGAVMPSGGGGSIGLGFAIPVDSAMQIANELIETGSVTHSYFGLATVPIPTRRRPSRRGRRKASSCKALAPSGPAAHGRPPGGRRDHRDRRPGRDEQHPAREPDADQEGRATRSTSPTPADGQSPDATITLGASPD